MYITKSIFYTISRSRKSTISIEDKISKINGRKEGGSKQNEQNTFHNTENIPIFVSYT